MNKNNWIFLRGLIRGNIHWGNFQQTFKALHPDAKMEFLEIPGNGLLNKENSPINATEVVDLLRQRSEFSQQNLSFHICGISLGGMIALKWVEIYPENIQSVNIINSSLRQCSPFYDRLVPNNYCKIIMALFKTNIAEQERIILNITSNKFHETYKYLKVFTEFSREHKISKINFIKQLVLANTIQIKKMHNIPLRIISSKLDGLVHYSCSDQIAKNLGGTQYVHPTAGHDLPLDEPEWLSGILCNTYDGRE